MGSALDQSQVLPDNIGMLAISKAGHDKGHVYIIIKEAAEYVYLADGQGRTISSPKRKNKKHIQLMKKGQDQELRRKLQEQVPVFNEEIKYVIKVCMQDNGQD